MDVKRINEIWPEWIVEDYQVVERRGEIGWDILIRMELLRISRAPKRSHRLNTAAAPSTKPIPFIDGRAFPTTAIPPAPPQTPAK